MPTQRIPQFMEANAGEIYGGACRTDPGLVRRAAGDYAAQLGMRGYLYQLAAIAGRTSIHWLYRLRQPTLILHANDDPIVPLVNAKIMARMIPNSQLTVVNDGHMFLVTSPQATADAVHEFLNRDD